MRIFLVRGFARFARKNRIDEAVLLDLIDRANLGIVDADLGGGLLKLRLARQGGGRSGGYRTIVAYRQEDRAFFLYGYAKRGQANVGPDELQDLRKLGRFYMESNAQELARLLRAEDIIELEQA